MVVDHDFEVSVDRRIDQSDAMFIARCERHVIVLTGTVIFVHSIDKTSGGAGSCRTLSLFNAEELEGALVIPIVDHDRADICIPI